jgi:pimeloyl-ACP methyl ester carboxylesterase
MSGMSAGGVPESALEEWLPPRAVTRLEALLLGAGARLDRFVLDRYLRRRTFGAPADGAALRARLARAQTFYRDARFLHDPDAFFVPPAPLRAHHRRLGALPGGEVLDLEYASEFVPVFPEAREERAHVAANQLGVARWWRHADPGRPAMLCVHGYAGGHLWLERLAFEAPRFYRAGLDVVLYVLPYHGPRTARGIRQSGEGFFAMDLVRTNEAFAQAIYELRALLRYVRAAGTGPVGAFGMSLGGYTTALLASVERELAFAVPMIPLASLADMMWSHGDGDPRMARAVEHGWSLAALRDFMRVHAPLARAPVVPFERRLIIAALGDRICPPHHAQALWRHWDRPRIHWYPGGHLAQFRRGEALRQVRTLLRDTGLLPRH